MDISFQGKNVHASTGGVAFDASKPAIVFLHGAGMDHTVWFLQSRWFAHRARAVLALDFPGHGGSDGPALESIDAMADWTAALLDQIGVKAAAFVGHSMGALVAVALAARHPQKARALGLVGAALAMPVSKDLLGAAAADHHDAIDMVNLWGHGFHAGLGGCEWPGVWMTGASEDLLERARPGVLSNDLAACNAYRAMAENAATVSCQTLVVQGSRDMMTPLKGARALASAIKGAHIQVIPGAGHMVMIERATETLEALASAM
ncbi:MAG: alpha/beta hydrolase [Hyphomicrobiales bacterium]|nr:alpha/beta hydrolase [Hyphomicrobiales bacterium]